MYSSECDSVPGPVICNNSSSNCSKSSSTLHDNQPILQSIYSILDSLKINTSNLNDKYFDAIVLNNLLSKVSCVLIDNKINMNVEKWGGRGKKN